MATASSRAWPTLAPDQQKLLLAALNSNKKQKLGANATPGGSKQTSNGQAAESDTSSPANGINPAALFSFTNSTDPFTMNSAGPTAFDLGTTDSDFAVDLSKSFADFNESSPDLLNGDAEAEQGEKRKSPEEDLDDEDDQGDDGTGEAGSKEAKKPGRKLLTSEPTTVRPYDVAS